VVGNARDVNGTNIQRGGQWPDNPSLGIRRCPAEPLKAIDNVTPRLRSYSLSEWIGGNNPTSPYHPWEKWKSSQLTRQAEVVTFACENEYSIEDSLFGLYPAPSAQWLNLPSNRHSKGCVFGFSDGHVEYRKWRSSAQMIFSGRPQNATPGELSDLQKLQKGVPDPSS